MEGQINSALRYLTDDRCGVVLSLNDDVMKQLHEKHPKAQPAKLGSLLFGPDEEVHESANNEITGENIREAALRTKGARGPSNVDANGFQRVFVCKSFKKSANGFQKILVCKSFKKSASNLCDSLATLTRRLCTECIDPATIKPILESRLIPLKKANGEVGPIGVGEVIRRIIGKCVTKVLKQDILESSGPLQVCAGHKSGSEAALHAMSSLFQHEDTDAVLLVDASNAFNSLNRAAVLHNIRIVCPAVATFAINTYRASARLFVTGGKELVSAEGTTQGDPLAMCLYALSLQPLISRLQTISQAKQCRFQMMRPGLLINTEHQGVVG